MANVAMELNDKKYGKVTIIAHPVSGIDIDEDALFELIMRHYGQSGEEKTVGEIVGEPVVETLVKSVDKVGFGKNDVPVRTEVMNLEDFMDEYDEWRFNNPRRPLPDVGSECPELEDDSLSFLDEDVHTTPDEDRQWEEIESQFKRGALDQVAQAQFDDWLKEKEEEHCEYCATEDRWDRTRYEQDAHFEDATTYKRWRVVYMPHSDGKHHEVRHLDREVFVNSVLGPVGRTRALLAAQIEISSYYDHDGTSDLDYGQIEGLADRLMQMTNIYSRLTG